MLFIHYQSESEPETNKSRPKQVRAKQVEAKKLEQNKSTSNWSQMLTKQLILTDQLKCKIIAPDLSTSQTTIPHKINKVLFRLVDARNSKVVCGFCAPRPCKTELIKRKLQKSLDDKPKTSFACRFCVTKPCQLRLLKNNLKIKQVHSLCVHSRPGDRLRLIFW